MGSNRFNNGMGHKRGSLSGYPLLGNAGNRGLFNDKKILKAMFNAFGIMALILYTYTKLYNWLVLDIGGTNPKELVLWVLGGLYLCTKVFGMALRMWYYNKKLKQDEELRQIEIEERKRGIEGSQAKARRKDFDDNQITG